MNMITKNSVIQFINDNGEVSYERILWLDVPANCIVVFDLGEKDSFPIWKNLSDIQTLLDTKQCKIVDYKSERLAIQEDDLSDAEKEEYERSWFIIKELVGNEPNIYMEEQRAKLIKKAVEDNGVYYNYIYRKLRAYWRYGIVKAALLPANYKKGGKGRTRVCTEAKRGRPFKNCNCTNIGMNISKDILELFKKAYKRYYLNTQKMTMRGAYYRMLQDFFNVEVASDSNGRKIVILPNGEELPSFGAFKYWYKKTYNTKETLIKRQGERDFELNHKAMLGESTSEAYHPGSMFQVDATIADIYLVSRDNRNWIIGRPVVYMVIDVFSRCIVGFYVGLEGPSWLGAMMALYNTNRNKVELCKEYGINIEEDEWPCCNLPDSLIVDRGELESTKPYNLVSNLGINIKILPPYKATWKGIVEQTFRRFNEKTLHWLPGTVKREFHVRGERDYRKDAFLNLYEFTQILIHSILYFNNNYMDYYNRDEQMLAEDILAKPLSLWKWGIEKRGGLLKTFPEDIIKLNLMPTENASITYRGLLFRKMRYSCVEDIETGVYEKARKYGSISVKVSYDPRNMEYLYINLHSRPQCNEVGGSISISS